MLVKGATVDHLTIINYLEAQGVLYLMLSLMYLATLWNQLQVLNYW